MNKRLQLKRAFRKSDNTKLRIIGHGREVYYINEDGSQGDHCGSDGLGYLDADVADLDELNVHLVGYGLPRLQDWEDIPDMLGWYEVCCACDSYMADYVIEVQVVALVPFVLKEDNE